jgi:hypothetical protein
MWELWSIVELLECHALLDIYDELERREAKRAQPKVKGHG